MRTEKGGKKMNRNARIINRQHSMVCLTSDTSITVIIISGTCKWNASTLRFIECVPERVITSSNQSAQQPSRADDKTQTF